MISKNHLFVRFALASALAGCIASAVYAAEPSAAEAEPPEVPIRTWRDDTGEYQVEARLEGLLGTKVCLRKADGKMIRVLITELCVADRIAVMHGILEQTADRLQRRPANAAAAEPGDLLVRDPSYRFAYLVRAKVWLLHQNLPRALEDLDAHIKSMPDMVYPYFLRSSVHRILGNRELAVADYDKAMTLSASAKGTKYDPQRDRPDKDPAGPDAARPNNEPAPFSSPSPSPPRKPPFSVTVSPATTNIVGPLRDGGAVDYIAAVNEECGRGVTPENNAVVPMMRAMGPNIFFEGQNKEFFQAIGSPLPPEEGNYFVALKFYLEVVAEEDSDTPVDLSRVEAWTKYEDALRRPWAKNEFPLLEEWIEANDQAMRLVVQASRRPRYFAPLLEGPDWPGLCGTLLPLEPELYEASKLLVARAMLRLHEGQVREARRDLLACHDLARLVKQGPTLMHSLIGGSISSKAIFGEGALARHGLLSVKQARRYAADLNQVSSKMNIADKIDGADRWTALDVAVRTAKGGPAAFLNMINLLMTVNDEEVLTDPVNEDIPLARIWLYNETLDWDELLRIINVAFDQIATACRHSLREDRVRAVKKFDKKARVMSRRIKSDLSGPRMMSISGGIVPPEMKAEHLAGFLLAFTLPDLQLMINAEDKEAVRWQLCRLVYALAGYRADEGSYPDNLSQLSPKYIDKIPADLFTGEPLRYTRLADDYRLYSLGPNGKDDGGKEDDVTVGGAEQSSPPKDGESAR